MNTYEELLNSTDRACVLAEKFLLEALSCYQKYGEYTRLDNFIINFEPTIGVFEVI